MNLTPVMVYVAIAIVCLVLIWRLGGKTLKATPTIVLFALVCALGYTVFRQQRDDAEAKADRARADLLAAQIADHDDAVDLYESCLRNVEQQADTREDLRTILFSVVDLSDVLPESTTAATFTANRVALIEEKYPSIDVPARQATNCVDPGPAPTEEPS